NPGSSLFYVNLWLSYDKNVVFLLVRATKVSHKTNASICSGCFVDDHLRALKSGLNNTFFHFFNHLYFILITRHSQPRQDKAVFMRAKRHRRPSPPCLRLRSPMKKLCPQKIRRCLLGGSCQCR